jgi:hypothetical protein
VQWKLYDSSYKQLLQNSLIQTWYTGKLTLRNIRKPIASLVDAHLQDLGHGPARMGEKRSLSMSSMRDALTLGVSVVNRVLSFK